MKFLVTAILYILASFSAFSITNDSESALISKADSAYNSDNYESALNLYLQAAQNGADDNLLYNIGNTYYRLNQLGKAVLYYERALKLNPTNSDAKLNLEFVNTKTIDEISDNRGSFISNTISDIAKWFTANTWAVISLIIFIFLLLAIAAYLFSGNIMLKKTGFFGGLILFFILIITVSLALYSAFMVKSHDDAVIVSPSTILSTKPRAPQTRDEEAMLLHEGTKMVILDSINTWDANGNKWYEVAIDNNHRAWIKDTDIERI
ncbi:MAG: tetratricopeptide repeat protein [Paramuribaculum sp.]|nr:tetratricopeptide repeat protein [Paramuribaculum sp.]